MKIIKLINEPKEPNSWELELSNDELIKYMETDKKIALAFMKWLKSNYGAK